VRAVETAFVPPAERSYPPDAEPDEVAGEVGTGRTTGDDADTESDRATDDADAGGSTHSGTAPEATDADAILDGLGAGASGDGSKGDDGAAGTETGTERDEAAAETGAGRSGSGLSEAARRLADRGSTRDDE